MPYFSAWLRHCESYINVLQSSQPICSFFFSSGCTVFSQLRNGLIELVKTEQNSKKNNAKIEPLAINEEKEITSRCKRRQTA